MVDLIQGLRLKTTLGISEISQLNGRLLHASFDLKTLGRLIKLKTLCILIIKEFV